MKKTIYSAFIWVLGAALVSSCNSSSDLTSSSLIQKRKYTKGYHVDFGAKKRDKPSTVLALEEASTRDAAPIAVSAPAPERPVLTASVDNAIEEVSTSKFENLRHDEPESTQMPADIGADLAASDATAVQSFADINRSEMRKSIRSHRKAARNASAASAAASASGESLLLYVILAIFIPPLAVGLLYGIGTEFWISLLLTLKFLA
ncbi:MAG: YqaE/Pmp3 family membrane protein [Flavobacteriales bacterium]|nr:YqaE/Pmp3 family membrane protein [Flavobacteriales bacterium]